MTKPDTVSFEIYDEVRRERDQYKREASMLRRAAQAAADELAETRRQAHSVANRSAWGGAINGRW